MTTIRRVGVVYHPALDGAEAVARELAALVAAHGAAEWVAPLPRDASSDGLAEAVAGSDLLVCVGGDGTVLHAAGIAARSGTPVYGVRMGRLGFKKGDAF
mgnify:FL=1